MNSCMYCDRPAISNIDHLLCESHFDLILIISHLRRKGEAVTLEKIIQISKAVEDTLTLRPGDVVPLMNQIEETMKTKVQLAEAKLIADRIKALLTPACDRIEIAGSIRRKKAEVGDIEIVCIPRLQPNLWGDEEQSVLDPFLDCLVGDGILIRGERNGPKWKQFFVPEPGTVGVKLDLFITTPAEWGYQFTIRTGPADFSKKLVTPRKYGGLMPSHLKAKGSRWLNNGRPLKTPEEADVFNLMGIEWIDPEGR